jgi:hypothetical protein
MNGLGCITRHNQVLRMLAQIVDPRPPCAAMRGQPRRSRNMLKVFSTAARSRAGARSVWKKNSDG